MGLHLLAENLRYGVEPAELNIGVASRALERAVAEFDAADAAGKRGKASARELLALAETVEYRRTLLSTAVMTARRIADDSTMVARVGIRKPQRELDIERWFKAELDALRGEDIVEFVHASVEGGDPVAAHVAAALVRKRLERNSQLETRELVEALKAAEAIGFATSFARLLQAARALSEQAEAAWAVHQAARRAKAAAVIAGDRAQRELAAVEAEAQAAQAAAEAARQRAEELRARAGHFDDAA